MTCASQVFRHSRKIRNTSGLVKHDCAALVRWFASDTRAFTNKGDDILMVRQPGYGLSISNYPQGSKSATVGLGNSYRAICTAMVSSVGKPKGTVPAAGMFLNRESSCQLMHLRRRLSSKADLPPHQEIGMPSLSPTMTEGNIARWLKKEGDKVSPGEVLCEVETDKATVEMECMEEGYLAKILRGDGSSGIKVGEVIAITVEEQEDIAKFKDYQPSTSDAAPAPKAPPPPPQPKEEVAKESLPSSQPKASKPSAPPADRIFASPLARKLAEDHNVPLSNIKGTGPEGRILKADIEDYLASHGREASAAAAPKAESGLDYTDIPHSQIRKVTASRLLLSKQTIPHYYLTVDSCVDKLMELRSQLNLLQEASGGKKISVNDLVIKAAALALRKVPQCNSSWTNDYIRQFHNVNISVAVQTDKGLYVPVVRDADKKGLSKIAEEVKYLAQKAKENSLKPEDYEGGTFTVTNLGGPFGVKQFCAIVNPPQAAILAIGSAERRVVPSQGPDQFKFSSLMSATLSCDHRVIDGAIGAEWLKAFKGYIENPESMLL
ncbi:dihydrolipoyllysine-residue acetyltransferase component 3 of pyruvate dehydrogenase complex, mitochondrial-like [Ipomoea triloba]|uniref:dihydrolipoyllysine-residue acetyltransferase component 3 of pyruvate dehydrogenase complex, mitochondrial-like n=1 Tax=Ipomoea triloba TaxID=35885 RepID=UPI00125E420A|nr:dihydrolipoyllysine-residue acetyltransferase component 3 of pyruvate dehydrogenase complex, mitochondrial-like [Ipomoea triloba]